MKIIKESQWVTAIIGCSIKTVAMISVCCRVYLPKIESTFMIGQVSQNCFIVIILFIKGYEYMAF